MTYDDQGEGERPFTFETERFVATLAEIAAAQGDALAVAVLAEATPSLFFSDSRTDWGREYWYFTLRLELPVAVYGRLAEDRERVCRRLASIANEVSSAHDEERVCQTVTVAPQIASGDGWRAGAKAWLRGEGINNQGRVRSDNIAARSHDGLLFRSLPEIYLYNALKARGLYFAPLPVFLRGGQTYQRLEPDFVLLYKGMVIVVEIDGATVHRESPAEAHSRTEGLLRHGVRVERIPAEDCASKEAAQRCAAKLMETLEHYRQLRS